MRYLSSLVYLFSLFVFSSCFEKGLDKEPRPNPTILETADIVQSAIELSPVVRKNLLIELNAQKQKWRKNEPKIYSYDWRLECYCPRGLFSGPNRIFVENHSVVDVVYIGQAFDGLKTGEPIDEDIAESHEIGKMFEIIEAVLTKTPSEYRSIWANSGHDTEITEYFLVDYDKKFGFPKLIIYDEIGSADDEYVITVENFLKK